ncbi:hypothetical protein ALT_0128 [Aspergillus lentulus]|uniref:Uncharacterized protein n=1 Tax=Aspergillus lentulus TaxID=293939 RepID=A0AAN5YPZ6_ASPLE|nr:hypothetical protein CNMCM6069_009583 [Aspergillus lentulus]KAF4167108.1 hypothetical protein CNMCM6936_005636 [Aspergillus lentulus]KAF4182076.1 hypothetical protein CNMCM7927_000219 [Aspergillus lentulus]KAF4205764.1 hypothetical protein CNMCM8927_005650 [Aspergillus lentulus]GAQ02807.1 hypothetical protein ALT_0128 [Aspergillus lentulus]
MSLSTPLKATSIGWLLVSVGHTISARDWQSLPQFRKLPNLAYTCAKAGWYQGSAFFLMTGLSPPFGKQKDAGAETTAAMINYNWAQNPALLAEPINKGIAALMTAIVWVSAGWYFKKGVKTNGVVVAAMGALQAWAAFR